MPSASASPGPALPPPSRGPRHLLRLIAALLVALLLHGLVFWTLRQIVLAVQQFGGGVEIIASPAPEAPPQQPVAQRIASTAHVPTNAAPPDFASQALAASATGDAMPLVPFTSQWQPTDPGANLGAATPIFSGGGGMGLPQKMRARMSPESRLQLILKNGGTPQTEDAVARALLWLREHQNLDGSWGRDYPAAMTGLAVLCFLGHGDTPDSKQHGQVVSRGITFLTDLQARNRSMISTHPSSGQAAYEHGIATYALGEAYAMARFGQKGLGPIAEGFFEGVRLILKGQTKRGGWLYGYEQGEGGDTSVTGWQYQALKIADQTRLTFPSLKEQLQRTAKFLLSVRGPDGGFGYRFSADRPSLTAVGVLGLQFIDAKQHEAAIVKGLKFMFRHSEEQRWSSANLYSWYYNTQATFQFGGSAWERWNGVFREEVLKHQKEDGHWIHGSTNGAKDDTDLFCTTLCTLMLEVYYRYAVGG
jgi:hypothetical protein